MATITTAVLALLMAPLSQAIRSGNFTNITIPYDQSIPCEACIRSGYELCNVIDKGKLTQTCEESPRVPPTGPGLSCSSSIPDEINSMVKLCSADTEVQRHPSCGEYRVNL